MYYTPYTVLEVKEEISRVTELIKQNSGSAGQEKIRNGQDEYEIRNALDTLYKELTFWQSQLKYAMKQEGKSRKCKKFFTSGMMGV